jgi:hypothetical protein
MEWGTDRGNFPRTERIHLSRKKLSVCHCSPKITALDIRLEVSTMDAPQPTVFLSYRRKVSTFIAYNFGDDPTQLDTYGWYNENSDDTLHPVGQRQPNAWGLYDMHGNVWEGVQDWDGEYAPAPVTEPQGPASGPIRVVRGGGWGGGARNCQSACRGYVEPGDRRVTLGFRLRRTAR